MKHKIPTLTFFIIIQLTVGTSFSDYCGLILLDQFKAVFSSVARPCCSHHQDIVQALLLL